MAEFFENSTPRQMLEKAKREYQKLGESLDSDNIFNFFVTAYHVVDHIKKLATIPKEDMNKLYSNPDFKKCKYICNKSKHRVLSKGDDEFITYRRPGAVYGEAVFGESVYGGERAYFIIDKNEQININVLELGQEIIDLWETFFKEHNI
jgi:hypothetical protein